MAEKTADEYLRMLKDRFVDYLIDCSIKQGQQISVEQAEEILGSIGAEIILKRNIDKLTIKT